jgi:uncharacterized protein YlaI
MINWEQKIETKWNGNNKKHFIELGYIFAKFNDVFYVKAKHLPNSSHKKLNITCDKCGRHLQVSVDTINKRKLKFNILEDSYYCQECANRIKRHKEGKAKESDVIKYFEDHGCKVLKICYHNENSKITYIANCGHKNTKSFVKFKAGYGYLCNKCTKEQQNKLLAYRYEDVAKIFEENNCVLLSKEYINQYKKIDYICECGNKSQITLKNFIKGRRCGCKIPKGVNHPNYKFNKTDEERINDRGLWEIILWRKAVYEKDNYTCRCCNEYGTILNAHHIENYADNPELRTKVSNGITLCDDCHIAFHKIYGKRNNTKEQLEEFIEINKEYRKNTG